MAKIQRLAPFDMEGVYFDVKSGQPTSAGLQLLTTINALIERSGGTHGSLGVACKTVDMATLAKLTPAGEGCVLNCSDLTGGAGLVVGQADGHWYDAATKALVV